MNNLSWLIYAADVVGKAGPFSLFAGLGLMASGVIMALVGRNSWNYYSSMSESQIAESEQFRKSLSRLGPRCVIAAIVFLFIATAIPSRGTIYMIAASEIGETVVTSPDAVGMMGDLRTIIKSKLKEMAQ